MDLFKQTALAYKQKDFSLALSKLVTFQQVNRLSDLSNCAYNIAFLEMLIYFNLAQAGETGYFNSCIKCAKAYFTVSDNRADKSIMQQDQSATIWAMIGECYSESHNLNQAIHAFELSLSFSENDLIRLKLLIVLRNCHDLLKANTIANPLLESSSPYYSTALFLFLDLSIHFANKTKALEYIERLILVSDKLNISDYYRLVSKIIVISEYEKAYQLIRQFQQARNEELDFSFLLSEIYSFRKDHQKTISILTQYAEKYQLPSKTQKLIDNRLGKAYQGIKDYKKAFEHFSLSAQLQQDLCQKEVIDKGFHINFQLKSLDIDLDKLQGQIQQDKDDNWFEFDLIFNIGFPRSGTTLLDTVLDTQPKLQTLSEIGTIEPLIAFITENLNKKYPDDLLSLTKHEVKQLRAIYLNYVKTFLASNETVLTEHSILVDKMSTNTQHIPLISLLFPNAKYIFSVRHPMDCSFSLFQQNMVTNSETTEMTTLDKCVQCYMDMMNAFEYCQQHLHLDVHFVKYEELVTSFEQETNKIFDFIGLTEINQDYLSFNTAAKNKIISTASRDQVTQGLYSSSIYKWKNYEEFLQPGLDKLERYIQKWGYD